MSCEQITVCRFAQEGWCRHNETKKFIKGVEKIGREKRTLSLNSDRHYHRFVESQGFSNNCQCVRTQVVIELESLMSRLPSKADKDHATELIRNVVGIEDSSRLNGDLSCGQFFANASSDWELCDGYKPQARGLLGLFS